MKKNSYNTPPLSCLTTEDGQKFLLLPTDPLAAEIVAKITDVMHLSPGGEGREIFVSVTEKSIPESLPEMTGPLVCCLSPRVERISQTMQMAQLSRYIAAQTMPHGGLLIHGGLIIYQGQGIILAAPGGTGKSTACSRLPESWEALSDDATLIVQTKEGQYFAHPWPTWSRFLSDKGPGGDWNVEQAIPLSSIFFLGQSPVDLVEPLPRGNATAFVIESVRQMMIVDRTDEHQSDMEDLLNICLSAVEQLVNTIPIYFLQISLNGTFWEEIAKALQNPVKSTDSSPIFLPSIPLDTPCRIFDDQSIPIIYSGSSMNPTFRDADLLKVVPYGSNPYRVGDVICYNSHKKDIYIIHRIVTLCKTGVRTRGDNNAVPDPELVQPDEIIGKVETVSRASGTQRVTGGRGGIILHMLLLIRKSCLKKFDSLIKNKNPFRIMVHFVRHCFSYILIPRYVLFSAQKTYYIKIFIGSHLAGEYNTIRDTWKIQFPFSLFIDKNNLPIVNIPHPYLNHQKESNE